MIAMICATEIIPVLHRGVGERLPGVFSINRKQTKIWQQTEYLVTGAYARRAPAGAGTLLLIFGIIG